MRTRTDTERAPGRGGWSSEVQPPLGCVCVCVCPRSVYLDLVLHFAGKVLDDEGRLQHRRADEEPVVLVLLLELGQQRFAGGVREAVEKRPGVSLLQAAFVSSLGREGWPFRTPPPSFLSRVCVGMWFPRELGLLALLVQQVEEAGGLLADQVDAGHVVGVVDVVPQNPLALVLLLRRQKGRGQ